MRVRPEPAELAALNDSKPAQRTTDADLDAIRRRVRAAPDDGGPMRVKVILQELTEEVRIDARDAIEPTFQYRRFDHRQGRWS
jgi:hypothetical protein